MKKIKFNHKQKKLLCYFIAIVGLSQFATGLANYICLNFKPIINVFHYTPNYLLITNIVFGLILLLGGLYQLYWWKSYNKSYKI